MSNKTAERKPEKARPIGVDECKSQRQPLSAEAQRVVDTLNPELKRSGELRWRSGRPAMGAVLEEVAQAFRNEGWKVAVWQKDALLDIHDERVLIPATHYIDISR